ncbi:nucleotidyltransferase domain-containing protein [Pectobacterium carotovorum]|uniref:anti-phage Hailong system nucleotidyltransferase HalB n=1 Tax=Pectobacterium carotovorum TaxID=554 RepID=UPI00191E7CC9|nr:nucleotidyltransferase domain-containing protein [Pectobacterium carotovorum]MBL0868685.1 nucleotidyltransferase domain-containing protein [Pectobacterium carotovorum]
MAILTLTIYGSRSRGDYTNSSDIDLFAITDEDHYKMVIEGKTNLACYPKGLAEQRAMNGDLFILHICREAKEIYGDGFYLNYLKNIFKYKPNYHHEKNNAAELAWSLIDLSSKFRNVLLLNRRIAWCVRTILIASAAESREPIFSKESLVEYSGSKLVDGLISLKDSSVFNRTCMSELERLLISLGFYRPTLPSVNLNTYRDRFLVTDNEMGLKTLMSLATDDTSLGYS